jgi:hypothetical protein
LELAGVRFYLVHPLKFWWLKRRVRGGVCDGDSIESVTKKLGHPDRIESGDEDEKVWIWELGQSRGSSVDYSVLIRGDFVAASWFGSHRLTSSRS